MMECAQAVQRHSSWNGAYVAHCSLCPLMRSTSLFSAGAGNGKALQLLEMSLRSVSALARQQ